MEVVREQQLQAAHAWADGPMPGPSIRRILKLFLNRTTIIHHLRSRPERLYAELGAQLLALGLAVLCEAFPEASDHEEMRLCRRHTHILVGVSPARHLARDAPNLSGRQIFVVSFTEVLVRSRISVVIRERAVTSV